MKETINVLKKNLLGEITWQYEGQVLRRTANALVLEAFFNRPDLPFMEVVFKQGDRFVETFYTDRWYNVFEIHDRDNGKLKGWYCNICQPAVLETEDRISFIDLALDLWIARDGKQTVLDEDEFKALRLEGQDKDKALAALRDLMEIFVARHPFELINEIP